jgi:uncharacterized protein
MPDETFSRSSEIDTSMEELRAWHFRPGAFGRLNPPWENATVIESPGALTDGARAIIEIRMGPLKQHWIADHEMTPEGFIDRQVTGPFAFWEHTHRFESTGESSSRLTDSIRYRLPMGIAGRLAGGPFVREKLDRMFRYRHAVTQADLSRRQTNPPPRPLKILITGADGMIGRPLCAYLETQGHEVARITRKARRPGDIEWSPEKQILNLPQNETYDAVIHLAGENVGQGRWSEERKHRILESRRLGTRLLSEKIANLKTPPTVLVSASGAGFYSLDGEIHDESAPAGDHFLSRVCQVWEEETAPARDAGIRVVNPRIGVVLSPAGGALQKLLPLFRFGLGGPIGSGEQRMSWITIDDVIDLLHRACFETEWNGPLNFTSPTPVTNREFSKTLGRVLRRPAFFPAPADALRLLFGEMAEETVLADLAVVPRKLLSLGYTFRHSDLKEALCHVLGNPDPDKTKK